MPSKKSYVLSHMQVKTSNLLLAASWLDTEKKATLALYIDPILDWNTDVEEKHHIATKGLRGFDT